MKLILSTFLFSCTLLWAQAQIPAEGTGATLRSFLKSSTYDGEFGDLGYSEARRQMFGFVEATGGQVFGVYSGFAQSAGFVTYPNPINTEHVVPQSFFNSNSPMRSDLHNLRPTHQNANSGRGNLPFGDVSSPTDWYGVVGNNSFVTLSSAPTNAPDYSKRDASTFEPKADKKGDIARQVFYFYTVYPTQGGPFANIGDLNELYQWHQNDPVDAEELVRNSRIETAQGNRNPYIDDEELVYWAWVYDPAQAGCTDPTADNYDQAALYDDFSCTYSMEDILGCTYSFAVNYNAEATVDDGSCSLGVFGCTYLEASNYNPIANVDDGSCVLADLSCPGDLDGNAQVNISDLLALVGSLGVSCSD